VYEIQSNHSKHTKGAPMTDETKTDNLMKFELYKVSSGIKFYSFQFSAPNIETAIQKASLLYEQAGLIGRCYIQTDCIVIGSVEGR
jgi:hypothetical protein